ncbi:MAG: hypothetical protein GY769_08680 [bacterium]|nr:hypothetical protein [bacterium]
MTASEALWKDLFAVTQPYLSDASVRAAVGTALERSGDSGRTLTSENLPEVVAEAMVGLRLFCAPEKFGDLMMDLTEYCERLSQEPADSDGKSAR